MGAGHKASCKRLDEESLQFAFAGKARQGKTQSDTLEQNGREDARSHSLCVANPRRVLVVDVATRPILMVVWTPTVRDRHCRAGAITTILNLGVDTSLVDEVSPLHNIMLR